MPNLRESVFRKSTAAVLVGAFGLVACGNTSNSASSNPPPSPSHSAITAPSTTRVLPPLGTGAQKVSSGKVKAAGSVAPAQENAAPPTGKHVVGYYPNYKMYNGYEPGQIPATQLTVVNYAFAYIANGSDYYTNPTYYPDGLPATGTCVQSDTWADLRKQLTVSGTPYIGGYAALNKGVKKANPQLKTLLSIGGYQQITGAGPGASGDVPWGLVTQNQTTMQRFVDSCVSLAWNNGFDGIDLDWEFPTGGDQANFVKLLQMFRAKLGGAPLTFAGAPDPAKVANFGGSAASSQVDWVNVMAYDFFGPWSGTAATDANAPLAANRNDPNPQAPAYNDTNLISTYISSGFPAGKVMLGMPFYGHTFAGVPNTNNGLFQTWTGPGPAGPISQQAGSLTYAEIVSGTYASYPQYWDDASQVPYAYNPNTGVWISYDNPKSIGLKASFAKNNSLGGAMIWDLSGDSNNSLLNSINTNLG